ncbi:hypothetical protein BOX15_Mlig012933g1 [Macrostomum lignano]|uniref:Secreted protein n=2 Tax=Macrostomum lignano TaxID=282301 RepID=A0A1I8J2D2_9PLAT|nr:hypothetical protein BOX15_Mlig012933g1 [Macrostomum lignano]
MRHPAPLFVALLFCIVINYGLCEESFTSMLKEQLRLGSDAITGQLPDSSGTSTLAALSRLQLQNVGLQVETCTVNGLFVKMTFLRDEGKFLQRKRCSVSQDWTYFASCVDEKTSSGDCKMPVRKESCTKLSGYVGSRETGVFVGVPLALVVIGLAIGLAVYCVRKRRSSQMNHSTLVEIA